MNTYISFMKHINNLYCHLKDISWFVWDNSFLFNLQPHYKILKLLEAGFCFIFHVANQSWRVLCFNLDFEHHSVLKWMTLNLTTENDGSSHFFLCLTKCSGLEFFPNEPKKEKLLPFWNKVSTDWRLPIDWFAFGLPSVVQ